MDNIIVSVCCMTYNHEKYIKDCLDGFVNQKCDFEFEVLIHDDASNDETSAIIREYQNKFPDLIKPILQKENQWSKGVRNIQSKFNFSRAKGKYIAMCEGDDYWIDPLKLQKQVDFLEENEDYQMVFSQCLEIGNLNNSKKIFDCERREYFGFELVDDWLVPTASILFRNNLSNKDYKILNHKDVFYGDIFLFLVQFCKGRVFGFDEKLTVYRINEGSMTNSPKTIFHYERLFKHYIYLSKIFDKKYRNSLITKQKINYFGIFIIKYYIKRINIKSFNYSFKLLKYHLNK